MKFLRDRFLLALALGGILSACGESPAPGGSDSSTQESSAPLRADERPNILIFLMDTQRADYLGMYGHEAPTSPSLDAFAEESLVFDRAFAPASSTSPSHASLFTSTYPRIHGVWNRVPRGEDEEPIFPALSQRAITLAEVLAEVGYQTAAIADGGNLQENRGFAQGFQTWDSKFLGADNRVDRALQWLDQERKPDQPFFLFLHPYQVHTPYVHAPEHVERFADPNYQGPLRAAWQGARDHWVANLGMKGAIRKLQGDYYRPALPEEGEFPEPEDLRFLQALYQAEIRQMDTAFGRLIGELKARGIDRSNTLFLLTSDHGEEFWEHGKYGHHQIYESTAHIPFLVQGPGTVTGRRADPVDLLDVMPTLLYWGGLDADSLPPSMLGRVLDFGTTDPAAAHTIIGESNWPEHQLSWREGERKAMFFPDSERAPEVYELAQDPGEKQDLASRQAAWLEAIQPAKQAWEDKAADWQLEHQLAPGVRDWKRLSEEERNLMIDLGYVDPEEFADESDGD